MTRMMPHTPAADVTSSELEMFRLIRDAEGTGDWVCLHSLGLSLHQRKEYGEADFVVIAPAGVFCLEVKGGEVRRNNGVWEIGWPGRTYFSSEGPFKQAQGARWAVMRHLESLWSQHAKRELVLGWGVAFPDIVFDYEDAEWPQDVVFDQRDKLSSFCAYISRLENYFRSRCQELRRPVPPRLSTQKIAAIAHALRGDFDKVASLKGLAIESDRELISLSAHQYMLLDFALNEANPRMLCDGAAGTGKTLVAREAARRLAAVGNKVLFVCFNENLRYFLKHEYEGASTQYETRSIYNLLGDVIRRGGLSADLISAFARRSAKEVFDHEYPRLFESACLSLVLDGSLPQYDVIVVDEAQDVLSASLMNCLDLILRGGFGGGRWLLFYDSGLQAGLYDRLSDGVLENLRKLGAVTFFLKDNFRNPKAVVAEMCEVTGATMPICRRETISRVDYRVFRDARDQAKKLRALLLELMKDGLAPGQVTILSATREEESCVAKFPPDVGKRLVSISSDAKELTANTFSFGTIAAFKGLENDIVILTDVNKANDTGWLRSLLYVGMTRARVKLFALIGDEFYAERFG